MISKFLYAFEGGTAYVKSHPQILFALLLVIVLPLLFLFSAQQFLNAGLANQNKLQKDRLGILHDAFASQLIQVNFNGEALQSEIVRLASQNPDIKKFRIVASVRGDLIPVAALNQKVIGVKEEEKDLYRNAAVRLDESIIFEFYQGDIRVWQSFRAIADNENNLYFIFTETTHEAVDLVIKDREQTAYATLGITYVFVLAIAYWLIRITDYRYLYKEAQEAIKTKDLFTNMIAHELRAPLTAIRGYASMVEESTEKESEHNKYSIRIRESAESLLDIVNDLLDVARIQSGKLKMDINNSDVSPIIAAVTEELRASALEKHINLLHSGTETAKTANVDSKRLHQAITNLVSNAIKYTKKGSIELALEDTPTALELRVKDTGMGISADDQKQLFAPFFRVESDDVSKITGSGLGMWITRQIIELMGASIAVESIKGVGTHVILKIPKIQK